MGYKNELSKGGSLDLSHEKQHPPLNRFSFLQIFTQILTSTKEARQQNMKIIQT